MRLINYRADIDGLRAVAVLSVILYHAFPKALPGGFTGVDIFFVISGYLISGILYRGLSEGSFRFREFYSRRIRRLFPALITVLAVCLLYGRLVLLSTEYAPLGKHVAAGTLFIQNLVFWSESGYFDLTGNLKPLLHLWSLAVEEQFYIFFPPLLLLIWKRRWPMAPVLWAMLVISFAANLWMAQAHSVSDFFLTHYRAWEFLAGSLLAWWHYGRRPHEPFRHSDKMALAGALLLVVGLIVIRQGTPYPGWRALLPVAGSVLIIGAGRDSWLNQRALAHPLLVGVGLISYPLYLFHWPLLSFVHILRGENPGTFALLCAVALSFLLAALTYFFIEKNLRFSKSRWTVPALLALFVVVGASGALVSTGRIPGAKVSAAVGQVQEALRDTQYFAGVHSLSGSSEVGVHQFGGSGPKTLYFGDSNMEQYSARILKILGPPSGSGRGALMVTSGGVLPIRGVLQRFRPFTAELFEKFDQVLLDYPEIDRVVIGARWDFHFRNNRKSSLGGVWLGEQGGREAAFASLDATLKALAAGGKKLTLILPVPTGDELDPRMMLERSFLGTISLKVQPLTREDYLQKYGGLIRGLAEVGRANGAEVIDPMESLCAGGHCISVNEDGPIRFNGSHLRPEFVRDHLTYLDATMAP